MGMYNKMIPGKLDITPHIGLEIEFDSSLPRFVLKTKISDELKNAGLANCSRVDYEIIASNENNAAKFGFELTLLAPENDYRTKLEKMMNILQKNNTYIDERCGFHIHVDCRYRDPYQVYMTLVESQHLLFACANDERKTNPYCKPNDVNVEPTSNNAIVPSLKYDTIEVRIFESSFDVDKLDFYVKTVLAIVNFNTKYNEPKLIDILGTKA